MCVRSIPCIISRLAAGYRAGYAGKARSPTAHASGTFFLCSSLPDTKKNKARRTLFKSFGLDKIDSKVAAQEELVNLLKMRKKDKGPDVPHHTNSQTNHTHSADLLRMLEDQEYKYILVVTAVATRVTVTAPLKGRGAKAALSALKKI